jgi:hypothetical protein
MGLLLLMTILVSLGYSFCKSETQEVLKKFLKRAQNCV